MASWFILLRLCMAWQQNPLVQLQILAAWIDSVGPSSCAVKPKAQALSSHPPKAQAGLSCQSRRRTTFHTIKGSWPVSTPHAVQHEPKEGKIKSIQTASQQKETASAFVGLQADTTPPTPDVRLSDPSSPRWESSSVVTSRVVMIMSLWTTPASTKHMTKPSADANVCLHKRGGAYDTYRSQPPGGKPNVLSLLSGSCHVGSHCLQSVSLNVEMN